MKPLLALLALLWLSACTPGISSPEVASTLTATATLSSPTASPTVVWFPPTSTFTPFPTRALTPTPDQRPGLGEILLVDDFANPDDWELAHTADGNIAMGKNELTIALAGNQATLLSVRRGPILADFYAEITASPSLCRGLDEYGLLLRVSEKRDYYRFSLSCDGQARLDRVVGQEATSPQPWVPSGAIPPGAPSRSRLAVWAVGDEMHFFVNDEYLFTVRDPLLPSGTLGVFARSTSDLPVTVNYSELVIRKIVRDT